MSLRILFIGIVLGAMVCTSGWESAQAAGEDEMEVRMAPGTEVSFSPEVVAGYIHTVIAADRALYTTHVVDRMQENRIVIAAEAWKQRKALPLPAQMLLMGGRVAEMGGTGLRYRLASLWPIYEENGPSTNFEESGLKFVAENPDEVYSGIIKRGDQRFFKAIYADRAVSKACVDCHNGHLLSSKRDFKMGDVMGAIIISFPLPSEKKESP
ncbi:Tll0287-like domain-containing protein [Candidatus Nitrospira allomarina]|uniref:DUF3365 domain-containing protein n=1 Tax=Candidatus Nitrospira allomarina TaxID=3020900 RepID=A0AA96JXB0_9BACT|nr:DUF3365 domain-containing protein [Candidatus Nitrospira allomarina]WNM56534.1 DUF3365 domain-containing protein [Candidatus Nitrospira allomarina]